MKKISKAEYYKLPTYRAMLRHIRRNARKFLPSLTPNDGVTCRIDLRDRNGVNCLKSFRYKGRLLRKKNN